MRYVGGKHRIAGWIAAHLIACNQPARRKYIEPFVGSGAVFARMAPFFDECIIADAHPDLILLYQALAQGWEPPASITREAYYNLKSQSPSALRGFAGFGASFGGKWFGGYVDSVWDNYHRRMTKSYPAAAARSLMALVPHLQRAGIVRTDYRDFTPDADDFVYCDPPYAGTQGYSGKNFDSTEFWLTMDGWVARGARVVVSEMSAPSHWQPLAVRSRKHMLQVAKAGVNDLRIEALWVPA